MGAPIYGDMGQDSLAVMLLNFEVRVEVEDDLLVGLWCIDDPLAVQVWWVLLGIVWGGDVACVFGIQATTTRWI